MKNDLVQIALGLLVLVTGAFAEEILPKVGGVGFPVLLAAALFYATRRPPLVAMLFSVAAAAFEDALSGLPLLVSVAYFPFVAGIARLVPERASWAYLWVYPVYELWLAVWSVSLRGSTAGRFLLSFPAGLLTLAVVFAILATLERKAAVHA